MKVHGVEIPDGTDEAVYSALPCEFAFAQVQAEVERIAGAPREIRRGATSFHVSMRAADRMVQQWRKNGVVAFDRGRRVWVKASA